MSAKFVYNKDIGVIDSRSGDKDTFAFVRAVQILIGSIIKVGFSLPLYKIFPTKLYRDLTGAIKELNSYGNKIAEELLAESPSSDGAVGLLEQWLAGGKLSKDRAVALSIEMFLAGVDTVSTLHYYCNIVLHNITLLHCTQTANTATFMLHAIATNPEVEERLHAEISSVLRDSRLPTAEDLAAMPYVKGVVKETLR